MFAASSFELGSHSSAGILQAEPARDGDLQRAAGFARLVVAGSRNGTRIVDLFQRSPIRIMFPGSRGAAVKEAVLVNTAGGIAGGDRLEVTVTALANASVTVTSQAAERIYRALSEPARISSRLRVSADATLAWLPQETIVFNGGRLSRTTEIEVASGAKVLALEWLILGRAAHGEQITAGRISDGWCVKRDGRLVWADRFHAPHDVLPRLRSPALLADFKAIATLLYFGPAPDTRLQLIRDLAPQLPCHCVATTAAGLVITRFAAQASVDLKTGVREILRQLDQAPGSVPFGIPRMWSC